MTPYLLIPLGIIAYFIWALYAQGQERKKFIEEDRAEERGKDWGPEEQTWTSERERAILAERKMTFLLGTVAALKKQMLAFAYQENPGLADLDSQKYAALNSLAEDHARHFIKELEEFKKKAGVR